jgi:hypothetical protein
MLTVFIDEIVVLRVAVRSLSYSCSEKIFQSRSLVGEECAPQAANVLIDLPRVVAARFTVSCQKAEWS